MAQSTRPYFAVDFTADRKLANIQPVKVVVRQREYNHDVVVLSFQDAGIGRRRYRKGSPMVLRWGYAPRELETFYGYVHSSKLVQPPNGGRARLEVYCVGPSFRMNRTRMRSHKKLNVVPLIRRICVEHRMTMRNDPSSRFHNHIPQLGRSDFRLVCDLARDIGFTLHVKRTELQFKRRVIDTTSGRQTTFRYSGGFGPTRGTLFEFVHKAGSAPLANNRRLVVGGVDDTGKPFWATDPDEDCCDAGDAPSFTEYWLDEAPASIHEGRELLSGLNRMNRFYVVANAVTSGAPRLRCGETVRLTDVNEEMAGYWWAGAVEHRLEGQTPGAPTIYRAHLELGRETLQQVLCVSEQRPPSERPVAYDPCDGDRPAPEEPTVFDRVDDCPPIEQPPRGPCHCPPKRCPGSHTPLPTTGRTPPRLDKWAARAVTSRPLAGRR